MKSFQDEIANTSFFTSFCSEFPPVCFQTGNAIHRSLDCVARHSLAIDQTWACAALACAKAPEEKHLF